MSKNSKSNYGDLAKKALFGTSSESKIEKMSNDYKKTILKVIKNELLRAEKIKKLFGNETGVRQIFGFLRMAEESLFTRNHSYYADFIIGAQMLLDEYENKSRPQTGS
jgi:hypothetical protein